MSKIFLFFLNYYYFNMIYLIINNLCVIYFITMYVVTSLVLFISFIFYSLQCNCLTVESVQGKQYSLSDCSMLVTIKRKKRREEIW